MSSFTTWIRSDALSAKAVRTFAYTFLSVVLTAWFATIPDSDPTGASFVAPKISGIIDAFSESWDFAAGAAFVAALGTLGLTGLLQRNQTPPR